MRYIKDTEENLTQISSLLGSSQQMDEKTLTVLKRDLHTIKGNSRTLGFAFIAEQLHTLETALTLNEEGSNEVLKDEVQIALNILGDYKTVAEEKLQRGNTTPEGSSQMDTMLSEIKSKLSDSSLNDSAQSALDWVYQRILANMNPSIVKALDPVVASLSSLANDLGKKAPMVSFVGCDFPIHSDAAQKLEGIFMHIFRNSLDHGFSKEEVGKIQLEAAVNETGVQLRYSDSGAGLNLKKLHEKGLQQGILNADSSELETANLIFHAGLSTAATISQISGRGVGMDAVKGSIEDMGGSIELELNDRVIDKPDNRRFQMKIFLPTECYSVEKEKTEFRDFQLPCSA